MQNIKLLNLDEVAAMLRIAKTTVYYKVVQRRRGLCDFPLPIGGKCQRLLWLADEVERSVLRCNESNNPDTTQGKRKCSAKTVEVLKKYGLEVPQ
jgi:predicted DNA-binding transcriptional regulator AlpA